MFRNLPTEAFDQIQSLTKPYIGKLPPVDSTMPIDGDLKAQTARESAKKLLSCEAGKGWPIESIFRIIKIAESALILKKIHNDQIQILWTLWDTIKGEKRIFDLGETDIWSQAFNEIIIYMQGSSYRYQFRSSDRQRFLGEALQKLSRKGFPFRIDGRGASLTESSFRLICDLIEKKIRRAGGENVANGMLSLMKRLGRIEDGALLHARTPTALRDKNVSGTPWNYIYNLSLKYLSVPPTAKNPIPVLEVMEELAIALAATLDVEPQSSYENLSVSPESFTGFLFETIVYDELFLIPQWQPQISGQLLGLWIDVLEAGGCLFPIANATEWKTLGKYIVQCASESHLAGFDDQTMSLSQRSKPISRELLTAITSPLAGVNRAYKTPSDTQHRTSTNYPILRSADERRVLQPKAVAGRAFVECLYAEMRRANIPDLENIMGQGLERLTEKVFEYAGFTPSVRGAKYKNLVRNEVLEADLIFETDERIFLVECTKKPLSNRARGGNLIDALRDFSGSFLKLLQQVAQHEAHLRKAGKIVFENGNILYLAGRPIEKIAVNFFEHGSLQNRDMTMAFVEALSNAQVNSLDEQAQSVVKDANRRLRLINRAIEEIIASSEAGEHRGLLDFAMSTWWLSIDQLHYLASKEGDLWKTMQRLRHMTARSGDLVYETNRVMKMNELGNAMFEVCKQMNNRGIL